MNAAKVLLLLASALGFASAKSVGNQAKAEAPPAEEKDLVGTYYYTDGEGTARLVRYFSAGSDAGDHYPNYLEVHLDKEDARKEPKPEEKPKNPEPHKPKATQKPHHKHHEQHKPRYQVKEKVADDSKGAKKLWWSPKRLPVARKSTPAPKKPQGKEHQIKLLTDHGFQGLVIAKNHGNALDDLGFEGILVRKGSPIAEHFERKISSRRP